MTNSTISTGLASMGGDFAGFKHPADTKVMSTYTPVGGGIASIGSTIGRTMPMMYPSTCMLPAHATHSTMMNTCSGLQPPALPMKPPSLAQAYSMSILNSGLSSPLRLPLPPFSCLLLKVCLLPRFLLLTCSAFILSSCMICAFTIVRFFASASTSEGSTLHPSIHEAVKSR